MQSLVKLNEVKARPTLNIFDIDETLFHTSAKVNVMFNGKVVQSLNNQEFNTYRLAKGETYDFSEFKSAKVFNETSKPIIKMITLAKRIIAKQTSSDKTIIVTARADFDNKQLFLKTFRDHGIDVDKVYIERAGNLKGASAADNKLIIFNTYLKSGVFGRVNLFDDSIPNLAALLKLQSKYPKIKMVPYLVNPDGTIKVFGRE